MSTNKVTKATHGAGNYDGSDEKYTPPHAVVPILEFIPANAVIWCPMDTDDSEFVKQIRAKGNRAIVSHIDNSEDFFHYEPDEHWDMIISNPPFQDKGKFFKRAISFGKPFMFLMSVDPYNDDTITAPFRETGTQIQMMHLGNRTTFLKADGSEWLNKKGEGSSFGSAYIGTGVLPRDIVLRKIATRIQAKKMRDAAYDEIKDRRGYLSEDGVFIKEQ